MSSVLLVEDDLNLIDGLVYSMKKNGFDVVLARTVKEAAASYGERKFDLLVLDLALPDGTGFDICRMVRRTSDVPVIFLTAADEEVNIVMGLDMGGDDYITKPFRLNELISRMKALLRRANAFRDDNPVISSNGITVEPLSNSVRKDGRTLVLTAAEYRLLLIFMKNPNIVLTRDAILDRLMGGDPEYVDDNTLSVYIRRLRSKIEDDPNQPQMLLTVRGTGYKWNVIR